MLAIQEYKVMVTQNLSSKRPLVLGVLLLLVVCCGQPELERLSADEILGLMQAAYASAGTYRDSGTLVTRLDGAAEVGELTTTMSFSTVFRRPADLRFAHKLDNEQAGQVLLATATGIESWVEGAEIPLPHDSIQSALRGATAPSGGVSMIIPPLLFPEVGRSESLLNLTTATRLDDQEVDGALRIVLQGEVNDRALTLWLDPETYLVTRVEIIAENVGPEKTARAVQTVDFRPQVGVEIARDEFTVGQAEADG
jgi:hypothetical protein